MQKIYLFIFLLIAMLSLCTSSFSVESDAKIVISPASVKYDFIDQDFQITFTNGTKTLVPGMIIYFRANFWLVDEEALGETEIMPLEPGKGLQGLNPTGENYVANILPADNQTSADISIPAQGNWFVNAQRRIIPVEISSGSIKPGENFKIKLRNVRSLTAKRFGGTTDANEPAFWCVISDPAGANPEPDSGITYTFVPSEGGIITPGDADHVLANAPSQIKKDELYTMYVTMLDSEDNIVETFTGTINLTCSDTQAEFPASLNFTPADRGHKEIQIKLKTNGIHKFTFSGLAQNSISNPIEVADTLPALNLLWGDLHNHSVRDDGCGELSVLVDYARRGAQLDWYSLTSHDAPSWHIVGSMRWDSIADTINNAEVPGKFVSIPSFEWTSSFDNNGETGEGHRIVYARDYKYLLPVLQCTADASNLSVELFRTMMDRTKIDEEQKGKEQFMIIPHHNNSFQWWNVPSGDGKEGLSDAERDKYMPLVEIFSQTHGNTESPEEAYWRTPKDWGTTTTTPRYIVGGLAKGAVAGVIADGDNHGGRPGSYTFGAYTAVMTNDFTREGIFDALVKRHCYATSGYRLIMEFSHENSIMGDIVKKSFAGLNPTFKYKVIAPYDIKRLRIVRVVSGAWSNVLVLTPAAGTTELTGEFTDNNLESTMDFADYFLVAEHYSPRTHSFYCYDNEDRGWTSAIFLKNTKPTEWMLW